MYCANVAGQMIPPFFVYTEPKPRGYNTPKWCGATKGSEVAYIPKGLMDKETFLSSLTFLINILEPKDLSSFSLTV